MELIEVTLSELLKALATVGPKTTQLDQVDDIGVEIAAVERKDVTKNFKTTLNYYLRPTFNLDIHP